MLKNKIFKFIIQPLLVGFVVVYLGSDETWYPLFLKDFSTLIAILIIAGVILIIKLVIIALIYFLKKILKIQDVKKK